MTFDNSCCERSDNDVRLSRYPHPTVGDGGDVGADGHDADAVHGCDDAANDENDDGAGYDVSDRVRASHDEHHAGKDEMK